MEDDEVEPPSWLSSPSAAAAAADDDNDEGYEQAHEHQQQDCHEQDDEQDQAAKNAPDPHLATTTSGTNSVSSTEGTLAADVNVNEPQSASELMDTTTTANTVNTNTMIHTIGAPPPPKNNSNMNMNMNHNNIPIPPPPAPPSPEPSILSTNTTKTSGTTVTATATGRFGGLFGAISENLASVKNNVLAVDTLSQQREAERDKKDKNHNNHQDQEDRELKTSRTMSPSPARVVRPSKAAAIESHAPDNTNPWKAKYHQLAQQHALQEADLLSQLSAMSQALRDQSLEQQIMAKTSKLNISKLLDKLDRTQEQEESLQEELQHTKERFQHELETSKLQMQEELQARQEQFQNELETQKAEELAATQAQMQEELQKTQTQMQDELDAGKEKMQKELETQKAQLASAAASALASAQQQAQVQPPSQLTRRAAAPAEDESDSESSSSSESSEDTESPSVARLIAFERENKMLKNKVHHSMEAVTMLRDELDITRAKLEVELENKALLKQTHAQWQQCQASLEETSHNLQHSNSEADALREQTNFLTLELQDLHQQKEADMDGMTQQLEHEQLEAQQTLLKANTCIGEWETKFAMLKSDLEERHDGDSLLAKEREQVLLLEVAQSNQELQSSHQQIATLKTTLKDQESHFKEILEEQTAFGEQQLEELQVELRHAQREVSRLGLLLEEEDRHHEVLVGEEMTNLHSHNDELERMLDTKADQLIHYQDQISSLKASVQEVTTQKDDVEQSLSLQLQTETNQLKQSLDDKTVRMEQLETELEDVKVSAATAAAVAAAALVEASQDSSSSDEDDDGEEEQKAKAMAKQAELEKAQAAQAQAETRIVQLEAQLADLLEEHRTASREHLLIINQMEDKLEAHKNEKEEIKLASSTKLMDRQQQLEHMELKVMELSDLRMELQQELDDQTQDMDLLKEELNDRQATLEDTQRKLAASSAASFAHSPHYSVITLSKSEEETRTVHVRDLEAKISDRNNTIQGLLRAAAVQDERMAALKAQHEHRLAEKQKNQPQAQEVVHSSRAIGNNNSSSNKDISQSSDVDEHEHLGSANTTHTPGGAAANAKAQEDAKTIAAAAAHEQEMSMSQNQIRTLSVQLHDKDVMIGELQESLECGKESEEALSRKLESMLHQLTHTKSNGDALVDLQFKLDDAYADIAVLERSKSALEQKIRHITTKTHKPIQEVTQLQQQVRDRDANMAKLAQTSVKYEQQLTKLQLQLDTYLEERQISPQEFAAIKEESQMFASQVVELDDEISVLSQKLDQQKRRNDMLQVEVKELRSTLVTKSDPSTKQVVELQAQIDDLEHSNGVLKQQMTTLRQQRQMQQAQQQQHSHSSTTGASIMSLGDEEFRITELESHVETLEINMASLKRENAKLQDHKSALLDAKLKRDVNQTSGIVMLGSLSASVSGNGNGIVTDTNSKAAQHDKAKILDLELKVAELTIGIKQKEHLITNLEDDLDELQLKYEDELDYSNSMRNKGNTAKNGQSAKNNGNMSNKKGIDGGIDGGAGALDGGIDVDVQEDDAPDATAAAHTATAALQEEVGALQKKVLQSDRYQRQVGDLKQKLEESEQGRMKFEEHTFSKFREKLSEMKSSKDAATSSLRKELATTKASKKEMEMDLMNQITELESTRNVGKSSLERQYHEREALVTQLTSEVTTLTQTNVSISKELDQIRSNMNSNTMAKRDEVEEMNQELMDATTKVKEQDRQLTQLRSQLEDLQFQHSTELQKLEHQLKADQEAGPKGTQAVKDGVLIDSLKEQLQELKWRVSTLSEENNRLRTKVGDLEQDHQQQVSSQASLSSKTQKDKMRTTMLKDQVKALTVRLQELELKKQRQQAQSQAQQSQSQAMQSQAQMQSPSHSQMQQSQQQQRQTQNTLSPDRSTTSFDINLSFDAYSP
jgi:chromosome segregation ATPase